MAIVTEQGDAPINTYIPSITINNGDTWQGQFNGGDTGDSVWVNTWSSANEYDVTVAALDNPLLPYSIQITDVLHSGYTVVVTIQNGVVVGMQDNYNQVSEVTFTPDGFIISFTPAFNQSYGITLFNPTGTPDAGYSLTVDIATPPPPPPAPIPEIIVTEEADSIIGLATADDLNLLDGDDTMDAGDGNDSIIAANGDDSVLGGAGDDSLIGGNGQDTLEGQAGNDTVLGGTGNDFLSGGDDNDSVNGGDGTDDLQGGTGNDTLIGGKDNDTLDGGDGADWLEGGFGDDVMTGGAGADVFRIIPTNGVDTITDFTLGEDRIDVSALGVTDLAQLTISQSGTDTLIDLGNGNSLTLEGVDSATLTPLDFVMKPIPVVDTSGSDTSTGGSGTDTISGPDADITLTGGDGRDQLIGGSGNDTLSGGKGNDQLLGGAGSDFLDGGNNNDQLFGGDGADTLDAGQGNDKLWGDAGTDILDGGYGNDALSGGADSDTFVFVSRSGNDTITDFEDGVDLIDLTALGLTDVAQLAISQVGDDVYISLDGTFANTITLTGLDVANIDASDFLL